MTHPSMLFVYNWITIGDETHARCVCCSVDSAFDWPSTNSVDAYVLPYGPSIRISHAVSDVIPSRHPIGSEHIYASEHYIESAPSWAKSILAYMNNATTVVIAGYAPGTSVPFFAASDALTVPCAFKAKVRMRVNEATDLPDAQVYLSKVERHMRSEHADKWDALMFDPKKARQPIEIPVGAYLPATIESTGQEYQAVYQINEYVQPNDALMTIYLADRSAPLGIGTVLRRRRREPGLAPVFKDVGVIESVAY